MSDAKLDVSSYSGYRDEESPRSFLVDGRNITVLKILRMWIEENVQERIRRRFYIVEGSDGFLHTLYYDPEAGGWFYRGSEPVRGKP